MGAERAAYEEWMEEGYQEVRQARFEQQVQEREEWREARREARVQEWCTRTDKEASLYPWGGIAVRG